MTIEKTFFKTAIANQFSVEIGALVIDRIVAASGVTMTIEMSEEKVGNSVFTAKRPGNHSVEDIVIKRTFNSDDTSISDYWSTWANYEGAPEDGSIVLYNNAGAGATEEVARWNFFDAFPVKYSISDFDAGGNDIVTEELTLAITRLERAA